MSCEPDGWELLGVPGRLLLNNLPSRVPYCSLNVPCSLLWLMFRKSVWRVGREYWSFKSSIKIPPPLLNFLIILTPWSLNTVNVCNTYYHILSLWLLIMCCLYHFLSVPRVCIILLSWSTRRLPVWLPLSPLWVFLRGHSIKFYPCWINEL